MLEIYNENIRDLLFDKGNTKLQLREKSGKGVYVKDLKFYKVKEPNELNKKLLQGGKNRITGKTKMNTHSSRSHSIFTIIVEACETDKKGEDHIRAGKLNLVDLAGSER